MLGSVPSPFTDDGIVSLSVTTTAASTWQLSGMLVDLGGVADRER